MPTSSLRSRTRLLPGVLADRPRLPGHGQIALPAAAGIDFSKSMLLRLGIVLYGFRIGFQQLGSVGLRGVAIDAFMVMLTFAAALLMGTRMLKLDRHTAMLVGAGSAICGAAAVMATEPIVAARRTRCRSRWPRS